MSSAMVESRPVAMGGKSGNKQKYVVLYSKKAFGVPQDDVKLLPQKVNAIASGEELGALLNTKAPEKWKPYCQHGFVGWLKGDEGTAPYTSFDVPGAPDEWRILRPISKQVADKIFPEILKKVEKDEAIPAPTNDRQEARIDIYRWKSSEALPEKNQLSPEVNKWPEIAAQEETVRSCSVAPLQQKRKKGSGADKSERELEQARATKFVKGGHVFVEVGAKGTYSIVEQAGFVHIIRYGHPNATIADLDAEFLNENDI